MSLLRCSVFLLVFALAVPIAMRSQSPAPDTIRSQAAEVVVDAIVTDKRNHLVPNLTEDDFTVYEDGVSQKIASFRVHRGEPAAAEKQEQPPQHPASAPGQAPPPAPITEPPALTILLLDYSTTEFQNQKYVREASMKFVRERLRPNDLMAVFALGGSLRFLTDFTNDRETLLAALKTGAVQGSAMAAARGELSNTGQQENGMQSLAGVVSPTSTGGPGAASTGQGMGAAGSAAAQAMALTRIAAQYASLRAAVDRQQTREVLTAIRAISLGVKQIPGRKSLILFSQGFVIDQQLLPELQSVVDTANRAQVAIYTIDTHGLETARLSNSLVPRDEMTAALGPSENERNPMSQQDRIRATGGENIFDRASQVGHDMPESSLRYIAASTGGFFIHNTNDLGVGLARVSEEMRTYYVITYHPTNQNWDGKFRQVRVEVREPQLSVRARRGYYGIPSGYEILSPEDYQVLEQWRTADAASRVPLYVRTGAFRDSATSYQVPIVLEIPTADVKFDKNLENNQARLQIVGLVRDGQNNLLTHFGGRTVFQATNAEYNVLKPGNISFLDTLNLPAGSAYSFEIVVKDLLSGKLARAESGIYLRQEDPGLALSTVLLARDIEKSNRPAGQFLSVNGFRILPSARCEFHNGDNLIFYFDVYNPKVQPDKKTDLEVDASVLQGAQRAALAIPAYRLSQPVAAAPAHVTVARYVKLAGLTAGDYSLVINVKDALAGKSESAHAAFTVVN